MDLKLSDFDYNLPEKLIAQSSASSRDNSRLLVFDRKSGIIVHKFFKNISDSPFGLKEGDVLVLNDTKVIPARLLGKKDNTGGRVEVFLIRPSETLSSKKFWSDKWLVIGGPKLNLNLKINFDEGLSGKIISFGKMGENFSGQERIIQFNKRGSDLKKIIFKIGLTPVPPYIKFSGSKEKLKKDYQTIFAKHFGSVAAPTAGLHFTKKLLDNLKRRGIKIEKITLHVGLGTFQPVKSEKIKEHKMHFEWVKIDSNVAKKLNLYKKNKQRIFGVGTTVCRALESFSDSRGRLKSGEKMTNIFIYPGYKFRFINGLITNFHLPKSTLLMLVAAFLTSQKSDRRGIFLVKNIYQEAIRKKYRFYSFGDAMLIF